MPLHGEAISPSCPADVVPRGELAQPFETENLLQLTSCGPVVVREIQGRKLSVSLELSDGLLCASWNDSIGRQQHHELLLDKDLLCCLSRTARYPSTGQTQILAMLLWLMATGVSGGNALAWTVDTGDATMRTAQQCLQPGCDLDPGWRFRVVR